jgi:hypothetical protein
MKKWLTWGVPTILLMLGAGFWVWNSDVDEAPVMISELEKTGDACDTIAQKAAAHLPEALPFQRLEKAARAARVVETCMHDRAYIENPAWEKWAQPIAQQQADAQHISFNEAYETLKRKSMYAFKTPSGEQTYWIAVKTQKSE